MSITKSFWVGEKQKLNKSFWVGEKEPAAKPTVQEFINLEGDNWRRYGKGNIDLLNRPKVYNMDGSVSTVRSMSFNEDGQEILIPTVVNGRIVSDDEAINHYHKTGEYLGKFNTVEEANKYANQLHLEQEKIYSKSNGYTTPVNISDFVNGIKSGTITAPTKTNNQPVINSNLGEAYLHRANMSSEDIRKQNEENAEWRNKSVPQKIGTVVGKAVATPVAAFAQLGTGTAQGLEGAMDFGTSAGVTGINAMRSRRIQKIEKEIAQLKAQGKGDSKLVKALEEEREKTISAREQSNKTAEEFVGKQWVQDYVGNSVDEFTEKYSYLPDKAGEITKTVGNMLPSIANAGSIAKSLPQATTKLGQLATKAATMLPFMAQAAGSSTEQALNEGANLADATKYGLASGVLEGTIESISGGIGGSIGGKVLSSKLGKEAVERIAKNAFGKYALKLADAGIDIFGEGFEEVLSTAINPYIQRMTYDEKAKLATSEEMMQSFIDGALASLLVKGGQAGLSRVANRNNSNLQENGAQNQVQTQNNEQGNVTLSNVAETLQNTNTEQIVQKPNLPTQKAQETLQSAKIAGMTDMDIKKATDLNNMLRSGARLNFYDEKTIPENIQVDKAKIANGFYKDGTLWINKNSKNAVEQILGHELTHHLETTNSYTDLSNTILDSEIFYDYIAEKGYTNVAEYKTKLKEMGYADAQLDNELVARFVEEKMFTDQKSIDRLARQNTKLVEKIKNWISDLVVSFKGTAQEKELRRIENMYRKALEQARNTTTSAEVQYSIAGVKAMENINDAELTNAYNEAQRTGRNTRGWFKDKEGNWKFEFSDKDMTLKKNLKLSDTGNRLGDILEHDILFRAYPELADTIVNFKDIKDASGFFHKGTGEITLNKKLFNTQDWKKNVEASLIHEIQHAIQEIEGYPGAANPFWSKKAYYEALGEIEASDTKERFLKEKDGVLDRNITKPRSSEPNPKHRRYDKYMSERGFFDKVKDAAFPYYAGKGGKGYEILEEDMVENNKSDLRTDDSRKVRRYVNDTAGKEPAFSMPETDNQGRTLSKEQQEFFKDSKLKDEKGNLISYYHGTQNGGFNRFEYGKQKGAGKALGEGFYFTQSKSQAQTYASTEESINKSRELLGLPKKEATPQVYEVYLNAKNPLYLSEYKGELVDKADYIAEKYLNMDTKNDMYISYKDYAESKLETAISMIDYIKSVSERSGKTTAEIFKDLGYDALVDGKFQTVVFEPNQIKNIDNTNPTENPDIRYSMNDTIKKGEKAVRDIEFPKMVNQKYISQYARTLAEAGVTSEPTVDLIEKEVMEGRLSHERVTDKEALNYAENYIAENGWDETIKYWDSIMKSNKEPNKNDLAIGQLIYNQAVQNKDAIRVKKMIGDLVVQFSEAGRNLQAARLLKRMTPDGRLYALEKSAQKIRQQMLDTYGKDFPEIKIPDVLAGELLKAQNEKQVDKAVERIQQHIADQIPATWLDKFNAWRYLAMLGNPRTHIRNIVGNGLFMPVKSFKNILGMGIEKALPTEQRTKAILTSNDNPLKNFAENDFDKNVEMIRGENKYDVKAGIQEKRTIYKTKALETLRKANFAALEAEDAFFLKKHYVSAFAQAMKAKGFSLEDARANTKESNAKLDEIRSYAMKEAQKATYRDFNAVANAISKLKRSLSTKAQNAETAGKKVGYTVANLAIEGALPFAKTPANIVRRGIEYSPLGLVNGIYNAAMNVKKGRITATKAIDQISSGLSGTGIMALGMLLANLGLVTGGDDEEKKYENFEDMVGLQNYALKIGDINYTIDWSAPASMPLFVGVEVMKAFEKEGNTNLDDILKSITKITEPVFELSMLQGINSTIQSAAYSQGTAVTDMTGNMIKSYLGQYNPTLFGQIARTIDPVRRTTYGDKNKMLPTAQKFLQQQLQKVPFASKTLLPKYDQFGRKDVEPNVFMRMFENFISPGYVSSDKSTRVENELSRIYKETGAKEVLPSYAAKYVTVDGVRIDFSQDQYETYTVERGQKAYNELKAMFENKQYKSLTDEEKRDLVKDIYDYSTELAKTKVTDYEMSETSKNGKIYQAEQRGIKAYKYMLILQKADANANGYVTQDEFNDALNKSDLTSAQKQYLKNLNSSKKTNTKTTNTLPTLAEQRAKLPTLKK